MHGEFLPVFIENAKGEADELLASLTAGTPDWRHHRVNSGRH